MEVTATIRGEVAPETALNNLASIARNSQTTGEQHNLITLSIVALQQRLVDATTAEAKVKELEAKVAELEALLRAKTDELEELLKPAEEKPAEGNKATSPEISA